MATNIVTDINIGRRMNTGNSGTSGCARAQVLQEEKVRSVLGLSLFIHAKDLVDKSL
jgi:hypothetical protein